MAEGRFVVDTTGVVVSISPAAERISGYRREEVLGRPCTIFESETCLAHLGAAMAFMFTGLVSLLAPRGGAKETDGQPAALP